MAEEELVAVGKAGADVDAGGEKVKIGANHWAAVGLLPMQPRKETNGNLTGGLRSFFSAVT